VEPGRRGSKAGQWTVDVLVNNAGIGVLGDTRGVGI